MITIKVGENNVATIYFDASEDRCWILYWENESVAHGRYNSLAGAMADAAEKIVREQF